MNRHPLGLLYDALPPLFIRAASRPFPERVCVYNGVAVRDLPFLWKHDTRPGHKQELWEAVRSVIETGDRVVFVGGGRGVVPVKAAGFGCDVTVIEAAAEYVKHLDETATLNRVPMRVIHGVVGEAVDVWGDDADAQLLTTEDLSGDVLVLDCEGAETSILPAPQFDRVVVETHPFNGARTEHVEALLGDMDGGTVISRTAARHPGDFIVWERITQ